MKNISFYSLCFILFSCLTPSLPSDEKTVGKTAHFFDQNGSPLNDFGAIGEDLFSFYGKDTPQEITVEFTNEQLSMFRPRERKVLIAKKTQKDDIPMTICHESSHLTLFNLTKSASNLNEFRFFDEGMASIFGARTRGTLEQYKRKSLVQAAIQRKHGNVSFKLVQDWKHYYGDPFSQNRLNWYAYDVGASFVFFIIDTYSMNKLHVFFENIGTTKSLEKSLQNTFTKSPSEMEKDWLTYLSKIDFSEELPKIVKLTPPADAERVSSTLKELSIEFNVNMSTTVCLSIPCTHGVCYTNATWVSPKILKIKVNPELSKNFQYDIYLGSEKFQCNFISESGIPLPITKWSFKTEN